MATRYRTLEAYFDAHPHVTLKAFGAAVGVSESYISRLRTRTRRPSLPVALKIARRARVPLAALVTDRE